jgi:hypothetical protein
MTDEFTVKMFCCAVVTEEKELAVENNTNSLIQANCKNGTVK